MKFILDHQLTLTNLDPATRRNLKRRLTMQNPAYREAERNGRYTGGIPTHLFFFQESGDRLHIPRGFAEQVYHTLNGQVDIVDRRQVVPAEIPFKGKLKAFQEKAVQDMLVHSDGVLSAGTGSGKTVMALSMAAARGQRTLVIVHTRELLAQWVDRIEQFCGIQAGQIGGGRFDLGEQITVGMVQTLCKRDDLRDQFGFIIVDECHRCPSKTFIDVVSRMGAKYRMGLSATTYRRDGLGRAIFLYLGDCCHEVSKPMLLDQGHLCQAQVVFHPTDFDTLLDGSTEYSAMLSELTRDQDRNRQICGDVAGDDTGGIRLVLSDRKAHCQELANILAEQHGIQATVLHGGIKAGDRERISREIQAGNFDVLICTSQLIGEGYDLPALETLYLTTPIRFSGRLIQYVGRVLRPAPGKDRAFIHDYLDINVGVLESSARARQAEYERQGITAA
jgi:superfamily II DNA or RNA helicase